MEEEMYTISYKDYMKGTGSLVLEKRKWPANSVLRIFDSTGCFAIWGEDAILKLRDFLNEKYQED